MSEFRYARYAVLFNCVIVGLFILSFELKDIMPESLLAVIGIFTVLSIVSSPVIFLCCVVDVIKSHFYLISLVCLTFSCIHLAFVSYAVSLLRPIFSGI
jgi:hypothetical protein